jgi:DNA polymerase-3 subunit chi
MSDPVPSKAEVSVYQLTTHPLEKVLPRILEKVYEGGLRALVITDCIERLQALNASLWTYSPGSFLPHGMDFAQRLPMDYPIWLSLNPVNSNEASVLVLTGGRTVEDLSGYARCVDIFDGNDPASLEAAHHRLEHYRHQGHPVVYWRQSLQGAWAQA